MGPNPYGGADIWTVGNRAAVGDFRKISDYAGMNRWPLWAPDGQGLYFVSDRDGMENLWFQSLEGAPAHQLTDFGEGRLLWPAIKSGVQTLFMDHPPMEKRIERLQRYEGELQGGGGAVLAA